MGRSRRVEREREFSLALFSLFYAFPPPLTLFDTLSPAQIEYIYIYHLLSFAGGTGYGGATARACDAYPRVESEHVVLPTRHQRARITPDVGEARITAAAPYKAAITPSGSLSGAGLRDLPGPTSLSYGCNQ